MVSYSVKTSLQKEPELNSFVFIIDVTVDVLLYAYLQSKQRQKGSLCFRITNHKLHNNYARKIKLRPLSHGGFCGLKSTKEKTLSRRRLF